VHVRRIVWLLAPCFLGLGLLGPGVAPATADGPPPPAPPGVTVPAVPGSMPSGPTYEVTPGVGGSELPPPTDPKVAAKHAAQAQHPRSTPPATPVPRVGKTPRAPGAGPAAAPSATGTPEGPGSSSEDLVWELGAAALLVLVLSDFLRIGFRRRAAPVG
jgi:hypothetical protein